MVRSSLIRRKKQVSRELVSALSNAIAIAALQSDPEAAAEYLDLLSAVRACHLRTFQGMLEADEDAPVKMGGGGGAMGGENGPLWALTLLKSHFAQEVAQLAAKLVQTRKAT